MALVAPVVLWGAIFAGAGVKFYQAVKRLLDPRSAAPSEDDQKAIERAADLAEEFIRPLSPRHHSPSTSCHASPSASKQPDADATAPDGDADTKKPDAQPSLPVPPTPAL